MAAHQLLAEWHPQEAVILAWPDKYTDWQPWLEQVEQTYISLISHINRRGCAVLLLVRQASRQRVTELLDPGAIVVMIEADYNDTWVRDYGFLTCQSQHGLQPIEFVFNGWGNKFDATKDNAINQNVLAPLCQLPLISINLVCEGGALEIDQQGHLLSTRLCLQNPARNGAMTMDEYRSRFTQWLGAKQVDILEQGHLQGDDTDGHIDTLVRFTPTQGLVIQAAQNRPDDSHYAGLSALVEECKQAMPDHQLYLLPLPQIFDNDGQRLPASYANFLINNQQVLCPVYQQPEDEQALAVLAEAYPSHDIVAIDCLPLVQQFGSLHCISMQVPVGTLRREITELFQHGVTSL